MAGTIVDALRINAESLGKARQPLVQKVLIDAADEIERLSAELASLRADAETLRGLERLLGVPNPFDEGRFGRAVCVSRVEEGGYLVVNHQQAYSGPSLASAIAAAVETAKDGE